MNNHEITFDWNIDSKDKFILKVLNWMKRFSTFIYLDSHQYADPYGKYELLIAIDIHKSYTALEDLPKHTWLFGHHSFPSSGAEPKAWPDIFFFEPQIVIAVERDSSLLRIHSKNLDAKIIYQEIMGMDGLEVQSMPLFVEDGQWLMSQEEYIKKVAAIQEVMKTGLCNTMNFCVEYAWEQKVEDIENIALEIGKANPCPFSFYYKMGEQYAISTSLERFFTLKDIRLKTQPIKGTIKRGENEAEDVLLKEQLKNDPKEQFENQETVAMILEELLSMEDLKSLAVIENQGIYTFPKLHHLISTIEATYHNRLSITEVFEALFPMGSMTGQPHDEVMPLIHQFESTERALYSGTVGFQDPTGRWDFNVVIRTLFYNAVKEQWSFHTGGAITLMTNAEREWEEIQLKAKFFQ